jgi:uncharacterized protein YjbI with pentapeptide repeats
MLKALKYFLLFFSTILFFLLLQTGHVCAQVKDTILDLSDSLQTSAIDYSNGTVAKMLKNDAGNDYKNEVNFSGAKFKVNADFQYATFKKKVSCSGTDFLNGADFTLAEFRDEATFSSAVYYAPSNYDNTFFNKDVSFLSSRFLRNVYFRKTHFHGSVSFLQAEFHDTANFSGTTFPKDVDFSHLNLRGKISFLQSTFCNYADFSQEEFSDSGYLLFQKAVLPDTLNFSGNAKINNEIDLSAANLTEISHDDSLKGKSYKKHYIFLYKTDISKFHFDYTHFKLLFIDPATGLEIPVDEKEAMYEQALKNFQDRGQQVSHKLLDIEYQNFVWQRSGFRWVGWVPRLWWNYGYDKQNVFYWTFILLILFSFINFFLLNFLNDNVYEVENIPKHVITKFTLRDIASRVWYGFIYTVSIFFRVSLDVTKIKYHKIGGTILVLIIYLLGLVCLAYMANFVLQR